MARPWPLIVAGIILSFGAALVLQTLGQAQPPAKASDEPKDTAKRIAELEKKLADQKAENEKALLLLQREITILRAEKKERDMAKLKYVILERSIYVTDTANAKSMQKDEQDRGKVRDVFEKELSKYHRLEAAH